jgi:tRNA threonylcarbamoyladenosine biosynthesis protein TsaB
MNRIVIDATDNTKTLIKLEGDNVSDEIIEPAKPRSQATLLLIEKILKKNNLKPQELDEILVNTGPGSFTGTRVGVAIANALGFGLSIKVNGSKLKHALPQYS